MFSPMIVPMFPHRRPFRFLLQVGLLFTLCGQAGAQQAVTIQVEFHLEIRWLVRLFEAQGPNALEGAQLSAAQSIVGKLGEPDVKKHLPWRFAAAKTKAGGLPRFEVVLLQDPSSRRGQLEMDIRAFDKTGEKCATQKKLTKSVRPPGFPTAKNSIGVNNLSTRAVEYFVAAYVDSEEIATKDLCETVKKIPIGKVDMTLRGVPPRGVLMLDCKKYKEWGLSSFEITCPWRIGNQPDVQVISQGIKVNHPWQQPGTSGMGILLKHEQWNRVKLTPRHNFRQLKDVGEVRLEKHHEVNASSVSPSS